MDETSFSPCISLFMEVKLFESRLYYLLLARKKLVIKAEETVYFSFIGA